MYLQELVNQSRSALANCLEGSGYDIDDFVINIQEDFDFDPFPVDMYRVRILYKPTDTVKFFKVQLDSADANLMVVFRKILDELTDMIEQMKGEAKDGPSS